MSNMIVHDIGNHLTVILGLTLNVERAASKSTEAVQYHVNKLKLKLAETIKLFRELAKSESKPNGELHKELRKLVKQLSEQYDLKIELNQVFENKSRVNKEKLSNMLHNVVKNAKEAHADKVSIKLTKSAFMITDNGQGFTKQAIQNFNINKQFTTKVNGTGNGLLSLKKTAKEFNWLMKVDNKINNSFARGAIIHFITCNNI